MTTVAGCFLIVLTLAVLTACHKEPSLADARAHAEALAEALADSALARDFYFAVLAKVRDEDRAWDLYHAAQVRADSVYFIAYEILAKLVSIPPSVETSQCRRFPRPRRSRFRPRLCPRRQPWNRR